MTKETISFPFVFVINLKKSHDRRVFMSAQMEKLKIDFCFFEGVDGHAIDLETHPAYAGKKRRLFFGRDLKRGEMGCLLSHRAIYQYMVDHDIPCALVLEDDVHIAPDIKGVMDALLKLKMDWGMVRFLGREKVYRQSRNICSLVGTYHLTRPMGAPGGAYAYMLTRGAATSLLNCMKKNYLPVDILHGYRWWTGIDSFAVSPSPILADMIVASTIGEERFDKTRALLKEEKIFYPFTRAAYKIYEGFWKIWTRAATFLPDQFLRRRLK